MFVIFWSHNWIKKQMPVLNRRYYRITSSIKIVAGHADSSYFSFGVAISVIACTSKTYRT